MNSNLSKRPPAFYLRLAGTVATLILIGWSAWRSIPVREIHFSAADFANNRKLAREAGFLSPPSAISGNYLIGPRGVQVPRDGSLRYDLNDLRGFFRGVFQVADETGGKVQISAVRHGQSTVVLERTLAPARQDGDQAAVTFIVNLASLPAGTDYLLLATVNGTIDWREAGFVDEGTFSGFAAVPLNFLWADGFVAPAWIGKVMLLQSPARLNFRAPTGHHRLTFRYGINPALFKEPDAHTDGIGFKVELITATENRELANRLLEPFSRQSDRDIQTASIDLKLEEPGILRLSATPGPATDISWDWSIWQDFQLYPPGS